MKYWSKALTLVQGCEKVSDACKYCWLENIYKRVNKDFSQIKFREDRLELLKTKKSQIFSVWSDFGLLPIEVMNRCITKMKYYYHHTFLICTKRPKNLFNLWSADGYFNQGEYLKNIWWGCTIENQKAVDERLPVFLKLQGKKFLSCEPLLENIIIPPDNLKQIDLVIAGCESGSRKKTRDTEFSWIDNLNTACILSNVPIWVKQYKAGNMIYDYRLLSTITHTEVIKMFTNKEEY